jgi:hypothetical protein
VSMERTTIVPYTVPAIVSVSPPRSRRSFIGAMIRPRSVGPSPRRQADCACGTRGTTRRVIGATVGHSRTRSTERHVRLAKRPSHFGSSASPQGCAESGAGATLGQRQGNRTSGNDRKRGGRRGHGNPRISGQNATSRNHPQPSGLIAMQKVVGSNPISRSFQDLRQIATGARLVLNPCFRVRVVAQLVAEPAAS